MSDNYKKFKGLIIGGGSIGERHLYNLKNLGLKNLAVYDLDKKRVKQLSKKYNVLGFYDLDSALSIEPNFSIIGTFPTSHVKIGKICVNSNSHIFIEKPISNDLQGIQNMLKIAESKKLSVAVGYNLRFDKGLQLLKRKLYEGKIGKSLSVIAQFGHHIKFWRPNTDYKTHYILRKGSGIILDGSHEYDYLRWILNSEVSSVYCQTKKIGNVKTETESIASILLKFQNNIIASLNIDYVRPNYERECHVIGENGDLKWRYDLSTSAASNYRKKVNSKLIIRTLSTNSETIFHNNIRVNDMYVAEMKDFLDSILYGRKPAVDGWDSVKTLKIGLAALESSKKNKVIKID